MMLSVSKSDSEAAPPVSAALRAFAIFLAALLVIAHGCHGDEDTELGLAPPKVERR